MTVTINVFVALLIALGLSVGVFLVGGRHQESAATALASAEASLATVRDPAARQSANATAVRWEGSLAPLCRLLSSRTASVEQALIRSMSLRLTLAQRFIPVGLFVVTLGVLAGLLRRDRARDLVLYSSVTYSYVGKSLGLSALAYCVFVALSPFAPALWTLYPALGAAALGSATCIANLPPRI